jgi:aerobic-type carbon monoxide dehydrogenase small subunit (CoxS/CutS family)
VFIADKFAKCGYCSSSQLSEIRDQLKQYQGGGVDLEKNAETGIAVLTLNNTKRKNALSGMKIIDKYGFV